MPIQHSVDPSVRLPNYWLGPKGGFRWPFDATFTQWFLWLRLWFLFSLLLWLFIPRIVILAALGWLFAKKISKSYAHPRRMALVTFGCILLLLVLTMGFALARPLNIVVAFILAGLVALLLTRHLSRYITPERPLNYWFALPGRIARGPRQYVPVPEAEMGGHYVDPNAAWRRRKIRKKK